MNLKFVRFVRFVRFFYDIFILPKQERHLNVVINPK